MPILARFEDYYSPFRGLSAISTIDEPRGAFTYRSSTIPGLAVSGPFHGLLLTVLGSLCDFHGCRGPRCYYVQVINTLILADLARLMGYCSPFEVLDRFPPLMIPEVRLRVGHQH